MGVFSQVSHMHELLFFCLTCIIHEGLVNRIEEANKGLTVPSVMERPYN